MQWLLVLGLLLVQTRPSTACECELETETSPADGATGVPLDAAVFAVGTVDLTTTLTRVSDSTSVALASVASGVESHYVLSRPAAMLDANTVYRIDVVTSVRTFHSTFTTGDAIEAAPPTFAGLTSIRPETITWASTGGECPNSCLPSYTDHRSMLHFVYPDATGAFAILDLFHEPQHVLVQSVRIVTPTQHDLDFGSCMPPLPLDQDGNYCARMTVYDLAGNSAGGDVMVCAQNTKCLFARTDDGQMCTPAANCEGQGESSGCSAAPGAGGVLFAIGVLALRRRRVE